MKNKNDLKNLKLFSSILVIGLLVVIFVITPLLKFMKMEKVMLDATKRYYEINEAKLPTGNKIKKISLNELYKKNYIKYDLKAPYTNKLCSTENSWGRVSKKDNEYKYDVYLECGIFRSKIDHKGPKIKLKGNEEITIYQGTKYNDEGIESVVDDTDGVIDKNKVKIDTKKVDTSKVGEYEVTYTIKDSLENETIKVRKVIVTQTLNNIVNKDTNKTNIYKGQHDNNYVMIDGIMFKIVGINNDGTVKVVSNEALVTLNYEGIDSWLNDYFYNKFSDSAKEYISKKSKWCIDNTDIPNGYSECKKYSRKKAIGLLSIIDYKNAKDKNSTNLNNQTAVWISNTKNNNSAYVTSYFDMTKGGLYDYKEINKEEIFGVKPALNIVKDAVIISGNGSNTNPYILKNNANKVKKGSKLSQAKMGTYITYSGYTWRVIDVEKDGTIKVISTDTIAGNDGAYYTIYGKELDYYNPNKKNTLAYNIVNKISSNVKTDYFVKKNIEVKQYKDKVLYGKDIATKTYNVKLSEMSLFDLFSSNTTSSSSVWYQEIAKSAKKIYVNNSTIGVSKEKFNYDTEYAVRVVGYLNKDVIVKDGEGTSVEPYTITK